MSVRTPVRGVLTLLMTLSLAGCFSPKAPPSSEYEVGFRDPTACPVLGGTYHLPANSAESRLFVPSDSATGGLDMLELIAQPSGWITYTVKMREQAFNDAVKALRANDGATFTAWQEQLRRWQKAVDTRGDRPMIEYALMKLGPLPERVGLLTPDACKDGWLRIGHGTRAGERNDIGERRVWDTETWMARNSAGALLLRVDEFSTRGTLFQGTMRTGLTSSRYAKLEPLAAGEFSWRLDPKIVFAPSAASVRRSELPGLLVDIQQHLQFYLPLRGALTHFAADAASQAAIDGDDQTLLRTPLWIEARGTVRSNADVHALMRQLQRHDHVEEVELTSVRHLSAEKIEFGFRLRLKAPPQ